MEVKVIYGEVEQALKKLQSSAQTIEPLKIEDLHNTNVLDMTEKLGYMNETLQQVLQSYKELLIENEASTSRSVKVLKEVDDSVSGLLKNE